MRRTGVALNTVAVRIMSADIANGKRVIRGLVSVSFYRTNPPSAPCHSSVSRSGGEYQLKILRGVADSSIVNAQALVALLGDELR